MSPDDRKRRKELKRRDRKASRPARQIRQVVKWPEFAFEEPVNEHSEFESIIRRTVQEFTIKPQYHSRFVAQFFQQWRTHGINEARLWGVRTLRGTCDRPDVKVDRLALLAIGDKVFSAAGTSIEKYLRTNFVSFKPDGTRVVCSFSSLKRCRLPDDITRGCYDRKEGDYLFYSGSNPQYEIDGKKWIVGYSGHALERLTKRLVPEWKTYLGNILLSNCMDDNVRYATGFIPNHEWEQKPCLSIFRRIYAPNEYGQNDLFYPIASDLLSDDKGVGIFLRMGYCSLCLYEPLALITTFLPVGFRKTPENALVAKNSTLLKGIPFNEKKMWIEEMESEDGRDMEIPMRPRLSKSIHIGGIPQFVLGDYPHFISCVPASPE